MTEEKVDPQEQANSFDEVFDDKPDSKEPELKTEPESKEEESKEEPPEEEKQSQEPETKEESEKGDDNQESKEEPPSEQKEESWTKTAVIDERRKRQELEKKIVEFESKFTQLQAQQVQQEKAPRPDPIDDPEGAANYDKQERDKEFHSLKVNLSQSVMRSVHDDYDEMEKKFVELANNDPYLGQQIRTVPNPAEFAYKTAKAHFESENFKDPSYVKNLKEQMKKEVLAELANNQKTTSGTESNVKLPKNLTKQTSVASNVAQKEPYTGTLEEVFSES